MGIECRQHVRAALLVCCVSIFATGSTTAELRESRIIADDPRPDRYEEFGREVALDGDYAIVAARGEEMNTGAAYVYSRQGAVWSEEARLQASDGGEQEAFAQSVDVWGEYVIAGAPWKHSNDGAAYVFKREGGAWAQHGKLVPRNPVPSEEFGSSVGIYGRFAVVGAEISDVSENASQGRANVFEYDGNGWVERQILKAGDGQGSDMFGSSVAIDGDHIIVGSLAHESGGAAYVFRRNGARWEQVTKLVPSDQGPDDEFGVSVSMDGEYVVIGTVNGEGNEPGTGTAFVFKRDGSTWREQAKLVASDGVNGDQFGRRVGISGDYVIVGAFLDEIGESFAQGSAYFFRRSGMDWTQHLKITASNGAESDEFGWGVAIDGEYALVGAAGDTPGAAYTYGGFIE